MAQDSTELKQFAVEHENSRLPTKLEGTEKLGYLFNLVFYQATEGREVGLWSRIANEFND